MPLVRISVPQGKPEAEIAAIADGVHRAMVSAIDVPTNDRFIIITEHAPGRLIADKTYLGVGRTAGVVIVHITLHTGRPPEKKQSLYRQIADNLHHAAGVRTGDVMVVLSENGSADWSFGNGDAQLLKGGIKPHWETKQ